MKKKLILSGIIMALLIVIKPQTISIANGNYNTNEIVNEVDVVKIKDAVCKVYENKHLNTSNDVKEYFDEDIYDYIVGKYTTHQHVQDIYDLNLINYNIDLEVLNQVKTENLVELELQLDISYNYSNYPDINSGEGERITVVYNTDTNKILDLISPYDYYDEFMRENTSPELQSRSSIKTKEAMTTSNLNNKLNKLTKEIDNNYLTLSNKNSTEKFIPEDNRIQARSYALNNSRIVSYALNNCKKTYPSSGNGSTPYYDFSKISGSWDCTNFVSHALLAGGAPMYSSSSSGITGPSRWYYRNLSNRSSSWAGVNQLYEFLTRNKSGYGPAGTWANFKDVNTWSKGDLYQFHNGSIWRHSTIITSRGKNGVAIVTGRTSPGVYNFDQLASTIYPNGTHRVTTVHRN